LGGGPSSAWGESGEARGGIATPKGNTSNGKMSLGRVRMGVHLENSLTSGVVGSVNEGGKKGLSPSIKTRRKATRGVSKKNGNEGENRILKKNAKIYRGKTKGARRVPRGWKFVLGRPLRAALESGGQSLIGVNKEPGAMGRG